MATVDFEFQISARPTEPQRHRAHREGTEPPNHPEPRRHEEITKAAHPPQRTQRRRGAEAQSPPAPIATTKARRHQGIHEGHPPARKRKGAKAQSPTTTPSRAKTLQRATRSAMWRGFRPSDGRKPPCRDSVSNASVRPGAPPQRPALSESAGLATSHLHSRGWRPDHPYDSRQAGRKAEPPRRFSSSFKRMQKGTSLRRTKGRARGRTAVPRARRPVRSAATTNARVRRSPASHRRQAIRSPAVLPPRGGRASAPGTRAFAPLRLCVFGWVGGSAPLRLCASAFEMAGGRAW